MSEQIVVRCDWCANEINAVDGDGYYHLENVGTLRTMGMMVRPRGPFDYCSVSHLQAHVLQGLRPVKREFEPPTAYIGK